MKLFVTGGSGFVGGHFIERAVAAGHHVRAMARTAAAADVVRSYGAEAVVASLDDVSKGHVRGSDAVIHAAAHVSEWGTREQFWHGNVTGTERMLEAARAGGVRRFIHVGTEAALFVGADLLRIDESQPYPTRHRYLYSETKAVAEQRVLAANAPGFLTVSIRPRLVWGPRDTSVLPALARMAAQGSFAWVGGGVKLTSTTHVENLAQALLLALTRGSGAYFVVDDGQRSIRSVLSAFAAATGVELPARSIPAAAARLLARIVEGSFRLFRVRRAPPMTRFAIDMLSSEVTLDDSKARRELGYQPTVSFDEGLARLAVHSAVTA